jgi:DNA-binding transcriptional ArsR family regulator
MKPAEIQFASHLEALKAPQCRRIVQALYPKPRTLAELVTLCKLTPGSVQQHLSLLESAGLIDDDARATEGTYSLNRSAFSETQNWFSSLEK